MRERITKIKTGMNNTGRKEVRVKINKSGLNAGGEQRWVLAVRFANDSFKKITDNGYAAVEIDRDLKRMYFVKAEPDEGFKFTGSGSERGKSITFTIRDVEEWRIMEGCYFLLKDMEEGLYYIDYSGK